MCGLCRRSVEMRRIGAKQNATLHRPATLSFVELYDIFLRGVKWIVVNPTQLLPPHTHITLTTATSGFKAKDMVQTL